MGWSAVHARVLVVVMRAATPKPLFMGRWGGCEEGLRRTRSEAAGEKLGADPADRFAVNVGTLPGPPFPRRTQRRGGQVRCRLTALAGGGAAVVVRGRESRPHGEGRQHDRS